VLSVWRNRPISNGQAVAVGDARAVEVLVLERAEEPFDHAVGLRAALVRTCRSSGSSPGERLGDRATQARQRVDATRGGSAKRLSYIFEREPNRAGLPAIRLHDLRHTHATLALKAGGHPRIVQERLGHANVSITLDTYSHVDLDMQAGAVQRIAALISGGQG
jgi:integrase